MLEVLRKWKYYAKFKKCEFAQTKVHYLGRIIEDGTIWVDPKKVKAISKWQQPQNITELRGFLGAVGWLREHYPNLAEESRHLTELLKKDKDVKKDWTDECTNDFIRLKTRLIMAPALKIPEDGKPFTIETDASQWQAGAVLKQENQPCEYFSHKFTDTESRYTIPEKELFAIILAVKRWRHWLMNRHFTIKTDSRINTFLRTMKPTLTQWSLAWIQVL